LLAFATGAVSAYFLRSQNVSPAKSSSSSTELTTNVPTIKTVSALGRIEPKGEVIQVGGPNTERIGRLFVEEGQQVKKGQILAYLESHDEKLAERDLAASELQDALLRWKDVTEYGTAQIQEAQTRIEQIKMPQSFGVEAQKARVAQLENDLKQAEKDLKRNWFLMDEGAVSQQTLDNQATLVETRKAELNNGKAMLSQVIETRNTNLKNAQAQLRSSQMSLKQAQSQILLESAKSKLKLAESSLARTIIRAPQVGEVLKISTRPGEIVSEDGILELGDTKNMYVVAEVYETDIDKIQIGRQASIRASSLPKKLHGTVERIRPQIDKNDILSIDPVAKTDSRVVEVKIRLRPEDSPLVAGLINLQVDTAIQPKSSAR
jgi:HlyD family secretion protein